ncbi:MAG: hypothetical protein IJ351_02305 [Oscillospiraceae bacterium]|nr:hypothetical protein [Oscillospiraceae bacterium]
MQNVFRKTVTVTPGDVDRYDRLTPAAMLLYIQSISGDHSSAMSLTYEALAEQGIFWAVIRNRVRIQRMPVSHEQITLETWPMPTTRVAYPRCTVAYDAEGKELFRSVCLWVLMDLKNRTMLLPGKSGVNVEGFLRGDELETPGSLMPKQLENTLQRSVVYSDLDKNGHMNNTRYLTWVEDLLPSAYHQGHQVKEITLCYINEAREGQALDVTWELEESGLLHVDIHRQKPEETGGYDRVFAARLRYEK